MYPTMTTKRFKRHVTTLIAKRRDQAQYLNECLDDQTIPCSCVCDVRVILDDLTRELAAVLRVN